MTKILQFFTIVLWVIINVLIIAIILFLRKYYEYFSDIRKTVDHLWLQLENTFKRRLAEVERMIILGDTYIKTECPELTKLKSFVRRYPLIPTLKEKILLNKYFPETFNAFLQAARQFPEVSTHHYFTEIQNHIAHINGDIDRARLEYNAAAERFNALILKPTYRLPARILRIKAYEYFIETKDSQKFTEVKFDTPLPPLTFK